MVKLTRISLPVKVVLGVTVTVAIQSCLLTSRAVSEWYVVVSNVVEEVKLLLLQKETSCDRVYRGITPALVEETAILIKRLEKVYVGLGSQPVEITDLKVRPL